MRIVFVTHYTELYGANKSMLNLIDGLSAINDIELLLIVPERGKITAAAEDKNIPYLVIPFYNEILYGTPIDLIGKVISHIGNGIKFLINRYLVIRHARKLKGYDIIHTNSSATLIGAYFAKKLKKPHVWHIREFGWLDYKLTYNFGYNYFNTWLNKAAAIISISNAIYLERASQSTVKENVIIYNGVIFKGELNKNRKMLADKKEVDDIVFAIVGVLVEGKNQLEAIQAFKLLHSRFPQSKLLIVGSGEPGYVGQLTDYTDNNDLKEQVQFLGFMDEVSDVYKKMDCLLMCSKNEAFGRVTAEALSFGIPVIGYGNAGTAEIIKDGYNGMIYLNGSNELAEKMILIAENKYLLNELKHHAINSAEEFTVEKCVEKIVGVYRTVSVTINS
jgi:glycosyltransferase involved in cell wall biosynthesis